MVERIGWAGGGGCLRALPAARRCVPVPALRSSAAGGGPGVVPGLRVAAPGCHRGMGLVALGRRCAHASGAAARRGRCCS